MSTTWSVATCVTAGDTMYKMCNNRRHPLTTLASRTKTDTFLRFAVGCVTVKHLVMYQLQNMFEPSQWYT